MNLNNFQSPAILSGGKEFVVCTIWPEIRVPVLSYILCLNTLGKTELSAFVCLSAEFVSSVFLKSFKRSEDSYIGLADFFFLVFFSGKVLYVSDNCRCAFIHIDVFMNALRYKCTF